MAVVEQTTTKEKLIDFILNLTDEEVEKIMAVSDTINFISIKKEQP